MNELVLKSLNDPSIPIYMLYELTKEIKNEEHVHSKGQLIYAEGGVIHVFTQKQHWYLPGRFYMWIPSNLPHRVFSHSPHIIIYNIYFEPSEFDTDFFKTPRISLVNNMLREMFSFTKEWSGPIYKNDYAKYSFLKAMKWILPNMEVIEGSFQVNHPYPDDERLIKLAKFLLDNIETSYTIQEIGQKFGYSTRSLSRMFKENMGFSYVRFLRSLRITRALELMIEDKYSISEIASKVGYNSISSFSTIFKKVIGMSPINYLTKKI